MSTSSSDFEISNGFMSTIGRGGMHGAQHAATFSRSAGTWRWTLVTDDGSHLIIESDVEDVVTDAVTNMTRAIERFTTLFATWGKISPDARDIAIGRLKEAGRKLARALIVRRLPVESGSTETHKDLSKALVTELKRGSIPIVDIMGDFAKQIPLDLCVVADGAGEVFLGEICVSIFRMAGSSQIPKDRTPKRVSEDDPLRLIGYAEDSILGSACLQHNTPSRPDVEEIFVVQKLAGNGGSLSVLDDLNKVLLDEDLLRLRSWLSQRRHILHFNCHGEIGDEHGSTMRVWSEASIGGREMAVEHAHDFCGTFVFLNACSSVIGPSSIRRSLAHFFRAQNAACVACTIGPVNDAFATLFAKTLYELLDKHKAPIVQAIFKARTTLIAQEKHPMALFYTYVGPDNFVLA